ncbi:MAG: hypothetical protein CSA54_02385, partial [Gammaproteobacteria bacterium]
MKDWNTTWHRFRQAMASFLLAMLAGSAAMADDTEVFFGQSNDAFRTNPNIVFILDTSGSMAWDDDTEYRRIDRLKKAMHQILDQSDNFNVGLMTFQGQYHGGVVRYPANNLDKNTADLCDGDCPDEVVTARTLSGLDDATQNDLTGEVILDAPTLDMTRVVEDRLDDDAAPATGERFTGSARATEAVAETSRIDGSAAPEYAHNRLL